MNEIIYFIKEFEGIIGAILGTVATLIVTDILKRKGKLNIYLMKYNMDYMYYSRDNIGCSSISTKKDKNGELRYCKIEFVLDIYNSSELPKIMRDIKLIVYKDKNILKELEVYDEDTKRMVARCLHMDTANIFNINAKQSYSFNLCSDLPKEILEELKSGLTIKLNYKDEKNKDIYFDIFNGKLEESESE